jgi:hypothetical protein
LDAKSGCRAINPTVSVNPVTGSQIRTTFLSYPQIGTYHDYSRSDPRADIPVRRVKLRYEKKFGLRNKQTGAAAV